MFEIITISDASIVGTNGLKAGVQVWQKRKKSMWNLRHQWVLGEQTRLGGMESKDVVA